MALTDEQAQNAIIELFKILGVSLLPSELESISAMPDAAFYFHIQKGEQDGKRISIEKVRGYAGTYNASTNTPNLSNGTGTEGEYYLVNVAGSRDFGNGSVSMAVNDVLKFEGGRWSVSFKAQSIASAKQVVDLGNIEAADIEDAFNDNNFENPLTIQTASQGFVVVKATQNSVPKTWIFAGESGVYDEDVLAEAEDFLIIPTDYTPNGGNTTDTAQSLREGIDANKYKSFQMIDLGDILTATIQDEFNDDALVSPIVIDKGTIIKAIQNDEAKSWHFVGTPDNYNGDTVLAVADDFYAFVSRAEMEAVLAQYADKRLSNLVADLSEAEKTAIKNKLGVTEGGGGTSNIAEGAFTGELNVSGGNRYYDDYTSGPVVDLSLSDSKALGATAMVRVKGDLMGTYPNTGLDKWNFSGQPLTNNAAKMNELNLLYVKPRDVRIVNRIVDYIDSEAPTVPTNLRTDAVSGTGVSLLWDGSIDDVEVDYYNIYVSGNLYSSVETTLGTISDLTPGTSYTITVSAVDEAGNESSQSNELIVETLEEISATPESLLNLHLWVNPSNANRVTTEEIEGKQYVTNIVDETENFTFEPLNINKPEILDNTIIVNGTDQITANASNLIEVNSDFEGYFIFKKPTSQFGAIFSTRLASNNRFMIGYNNDVSSISVGFYATGGYACKSVPLPNFTNFHKLYFKYLNGVLTISLNGVAENGTADTKGTALTDGIMTIGSNNSTGSSYNLDFKEMFVVAGSMTNEEKLNMETYISDKHGL